MWVGVTGNIGSGKSTVARLLAEHPGVEIVDADRLARHLVDENVDLRRRLAAEFGEDLLSSEDVLDRRKLARRVFSREGGSAVLERTIRPCLEPLILRDLEAAVRRAVVVVYDAPLLLEWGGEAAQRCELKIVVTAPESVVDVRLVERGMSVAEVHQRRLDQLPRAELERRADFVIDNGGDEEDLRQQVERAWILIGKMSHKATEG